MKFSSQQGYITATYDELVKAFGQPEYGPDEPSADEKVTCEWSIQLGGQECRIYDWKEYTGVTPRGKYEWHIGGYDKNAERLVHEAFANPRTGPFAQHSTRELERVREAAALVADFAEENDRDEFEDLYGLCMELETELRERKVPGYY